MSRAKTHHWVPEISGSTRSWATARLKPIVTGKDFLFTGTGGQHPDDVFHRQAMSSNDRLAAEDLRVDCNSL